MRSLLDLLNGIIYNKIFSFYLFISTIIFTVVLFGCAIFNPGLLVVPIYGNMIFGDLLIFTIVSYFVLFSIIGGLFIHYEKLPKSTIMSTIWSMVYLCFGSFIIYFYLISLLNGTIYSNMKIDSLAFVAIGLITWALLKPKIVFFQNKKVLGR